MPENDNQSANNTTATEIKQPVSIGKVQRVEMAFPQGNQVQNTIPEGTPNNEGANANNDATNGAAAANATSAPAPTFTDDQLRDYFKTVGIEFDGIDKLKEKLTAPAQTHTEETPEQIKAKEIAKEKRVVDKFISGGGNFDQYTALKNVANADIKELSTNTLKKELKDAGFTETEVDGIIKERYYQFGDEDLEQLDEETDKEFAKRKRDYGEKLLANRSLPLKNQAAGILADIQSAIDSEDLQVQNEVALSAKIDEDFKTLPRKLSIEIGEIGNTTHPPVEYEVSESDLAEVKAILKDPAQRQQLLYNQEGSLNTTRLAELLAIEKAFKSASKISYLEAQTRTNTEWEKKFSARSPYELGVGGSPAKPNGQNGNKISGIGKVQRVQPQNR